MFTGNINLAVLPLLFLIFIRPIAKGTQECDNITGCCKERIEYGLSKCSICDNGGSGIGKCIFFLENKFVLAIRQQKTSGATWEETFCSRVLTCPADCNGNGKCFNQLEAITSVCLCSPKFFGVDCSKSTPPNLIGEFQEWAISMEMNDLYYLPGVEKEVTFIRFCNPALKNMETNNFYIFIVDTPDGFYYSKRVYSLPCKNGFDFVYGAEGSIKIKLNFPFKKFDTLVGSQSDKWKFFRYNKQMLGYLSSVRVRAMMPETKFVFYEVINPVRVTYEPEVVLLKCVPSIELQGCGSSNENIVTYLVKQAFQVEAVIKYLEDGKHFDYLNEGPKCKPSNLITITVSKYYPSNLNSDETPTQSFTRKDVSFRAYSLRPGLYLVKVEVEYVEEESIVNHAYCHFKVMAQPPVAKITRIRQGVQGEDTFTVKLSAENSYDPNIAPHIEQNLQATWHCEFRGEPQRTTAYCNPLYPVVGVSFEITGQRPDSTFTMKFTLIVRTDEFRDCVDESLGCGKTAQAEELITIPGRLISGPRTISIQCIRNCGPKVKPNQDLLLKAMFSSEKKDFTVTWSYGESLASQTSVDDITEPILPHLMLLVKANKLEGGKQYLFLAKVSEDIIAEYSLHTYDNIEYTGDCNIEPKTGVKGQTLFTIECSLGSPDLVFEFYDKSPEEYASDFIFSGRMLGMNGRGKLTNFKLTRGHVVVYIVNFYGMFTQITKKVELQDRSVDDETLKQCFNEIDDMLAHGDNTGVMRRVSHIPDIVPDTMDKSEILNRLLSVVSKMSVGFFPKIKMTTSTLFNIMEKLNKPTRLTCSVELMTSALFLLNRLTEEFSLLVNWGDDVTSMSHREMLRVAEVQLNALLDVLKCKDPKTIGKELDDFNFKTLYLLTKGSIHAEEIIRLLQDVVSFLSYPGLPPLQIITTSDEMTVSNLKHDNDYPITNYLDKDEKLPLLVSPNLLNHLKHKVKTRENLNIEITEIDDNMFWWCKSDVRSNLVSVSISRELPRNGTIKIENVAHPLEVNLRFYDDVEPLIVRGEVVQPNPDSTLLKLDLSVRIHRLDPEPHSLTVIKFLFPETTHNLRVFIVADYRPDYEDMTFKESVILITEASPSYPVSFIQKDAGHFLFMGIIPADDVPVSTTVSYAFEISSSLCQVWAKGQWSSLGCKISVKSKDKDVVCMCEHFSIFGAAFPVPPNEIDPFKDITLFITVLDNPAVVGFTICLLLLYLFFCIWAHMNDKNDKKMRYVVELEDNFPGDKWPYLISVYTSSRFNAGSTAHVGLRIFGTMAQSRVHILTCKNRRLLKKNSDDWFLIYCLLPLGNLRSIDIWHDNAGSSPDWFCDEIRVFDLTEGSETTFLIEQWLALRVTEFPEAIVIPSTRTEVNSVKRMFLDNLVLGLRESHTLLSIVFRHPRSKINRLQRISVLMTGIMVAMLCSIMFYTPKNEHWEGVDDHSYDVSQRDFYISIQSCVLSVLATVAVMFSFNRSYKLVKKEPKLQKQEQLDNSMDWQEKSVFGNFLRIVSRTLKSHPLSPVQLPDCRPLVQVQYGWLIWSWTLCIGLISVCAVLVMLYGLKLGKANSVKWLTSLLMTMAESFFIEGPGRIFLIAIILAIAFKRMIVVNTHRVTLNEVLNLELPNDELTVRRIVAKRNHPMYAPLRPDVRKAMLRKKELRHNCWLLLDFALSVLFVVTVSVAAHHLWSSNFYANRQLQRDMALAHSFLDMKHINFYKIHYLHDLEDFLKYGLVRNLYTTRWYNDKMFEEDTDKEVKYWSENMANKMLGFPRIRQLRVIRNPCENKVLREGKSCIFAWSKQNEDNDFYSPGWNMAHYSDLETQNSPWLYSESTASELYTLYRLHGKTGRVYDNGGYMLVLGPTRQQTELKIAELQEHHWQDLRTKVVFIEFTVYNVNQDLFSQVTFITEYLTSGQVQLLCQAVSVGRTAFSFWDALFIAFFIFYTVRTATLMNRQGLLDHVKTFYNISRLVILALSFIYIILIILHYILITKFHAEFQQQGRESYFDFDSFVYYFLQLKIFLSMLLCVAIVRMILLFRGGRRLLNHFYTLLISRNWIFWLSLVTYFSVVVEFALALNCSISAPPSITELLINPKRSSFFNSWETTHPHISVFLFFKTLIFGIIKSFYIIIFMYNTKIAKTYNIQKSHKFSFFSFILSMFKRK